MSKKYPEVGDFVFTNDSVGSGIIKYVGINVIDIDNNVNINRYKFEEIDKIL